MSSLKLGEVFSLQILKPPHLRLSFSLAILGGLIVSTAFTLIIVPTIYAAIRNRIPLKDYAAKDTASIENKASIEDALGDIGE